MNSYKSSSASSKFNNKTGTSAGSTSKNNKPFCKVCYDAGKSEREYTSHYVKSKPGNEGIVVCPYLLSLVCTYCKRKEGHTAKHCPVLAKKNNSSNKKTADDDDGWHQVGSNKSKSRIVEEDEPPRPTVVIKNTTTRSLAESPLTPPPIENPSFWSSVVKKPAVVDVKPVSAAVKPAAVKPASVKPAAVKPAAVKPAMPVPAAPPCTMIHRSDAESYEFEQEYSESDYYEKEKSVYGTYSVANTMNGSAWADDYDGY